MDPPDPTAPDYEPRSKEEAVEAIQALRRLAAALSLQHNVSVDEINPPSSLASVLAHSTTDGEKLSIGSVRESAKEFVSGQDLFSSWYFESKGMAKLVRKVDRFRQAQSQRRVFIGLVQATMMGKTRSLLEASKRTPLIIIRLDNSNVVYKRLLDRVEEEVAKVKPDTSFDRWRQCNRRVMLYVRAFFFSYMEYAHDYKEAHERRLFVTDKLGEIEAEINLFNASLLNGGQLYARSIFDREAEEIQRLDDDGALESAASSMLDRHGEISRRLERPTLAIDECHMPLHQAIGMLFHSDYKDRDQEDVTEWQRYELFGRRANGRTIGKGSPRGYPYSERTSLFSAFRWVLQEYLHRPGGQQQTAIFTSTFFSVWEPLMDTSKYSREKPAIVRVYLDKMLAPKDMLMVIEDIEGRPVVGDRLRDQIAQRLDAWRGRPGFFFDYFIPCFRDEPCAQPLLDRIAKAHADAERDIIENVFTRALEDLRNKKSIKLHDASVAVTGDEIVHFLYYCCRLRGGNVNCLSDAMASLVSAGFAIVKQYTPGDKGHSIGMVAEPLVQRFLDGRARMPDAYVWCDRYIANEIRRASGTSYGNVAEFAIANRIIHVHGRPLRDLLDAWGLEPESGAFLDDDMVVRAEAAASVDDLSSGGPTDFASAPLWRITMPRDGIVMPDLSFFASDSDGNCCLVTIQSKVTNAKLDADKFIRAIRSTSIHMLFTKQGRHTSQSIQFGAKWRGFLATARSVCFVRVIICTRGWTGPQRSAVRAHNKNNPTQPILLADASARVSLFGEQSAQALEQRVGNPQREDPGKGTASDDWVIPDDWCTSNDEFESDSEGEEEKQQADSALKVKGKEARADGSNGEKPNP